MSDTNTAGVISPVHTVERSEVGHGRKRALDIVGGTTMLLLAMPVMAGICVVLAAQGAPVIFRHRRVGKGGRTFPCLKFQTMVPDAQAVLDAHLRDDPVAAAEWAATRKLKSDPRVTWIGRLLRKTSLDELPQLLNVIGGHMSLVGPRPIVEAETIHYGEHLGHYHSVRPGLTGPWQISGRSDTTYAQRVSLDVKYVQERTLRSDISIILRTVPAVLKARGSY